MSDKKEKTPRQKMPEQAPEVRRRNFEEVPLGYTAELATTEASRCLQCKKPSCVEGCPVSVPIPQFIKAIHEGNLVEAIMQLWSKNALPAVCGRVCPQENQCEGNCILGKKDVPVAIGNLERFASDWARQQRDIPLPPLAPKTGKRVAVVGSGPGGLTVAGDMIRKGHEVTIFEAFHKPGGVLVYGIPEFRLPKEIVAAEVNFLERLGVKVECNMVVGTTITVDELLGKEGFDAVYLGVGAGFPRFLNVPGEDLIGVFSANEYLTRSNLMKGYLFPDYDTPMIKGDHVCVFGGGNVAMDSLRTAMRMGCDDVKCVYRRSKDELPARAEEAHHADQEGIQFFFLHNPIRFIGDDEQRLKAVELQEMKLGEPDASGRRRPEPVPGSTKTIDCDLAIIAVGTAANPIVPNTTPGLATNKWGYIEADEEGRTKKAKVWAGGDIVTGAATVIQAAGAGRLAADSMHRYLTWGW
ncbi:MAG: NADPH-dependent glutamate synthase [Deltaproteobacteria bacterium]|nr:NADPH-dependent glutamate synthase [Deltaproteobacteria bacterium]